MTRAFATQRRSPRSARAAHDAVRRVSPRRSAAMCAALSAKTDYASSQRPGLPRGMRRAGDPCPVLDAERHHRGLNRILRRASRLRTSGLALHPAAGRINRPATATTAGLIVLGQVPAIGDLTGIALVIVGVAAHRTVLAIRAKPRPLGRAPGTPANPRPHGFDLRPGPSGLALCTVSVDAAFAATRSGRAWERPGSRRGSPWRSFAVSTRTSR